MSFRNKSLTTKIIDDVFSAARRAVRGVTGFRQKARRSRKAPRTTVRRKRRAGNGYPKPNWSSSENAKRTDYAKYKTLIVDAYDYISYDTDHGITWDSNNNIDRAFASLKDLPEFKANTSNWIAYKILGMRMTFMPLGTGARVQEPIPDTESYCDKPILLPPVRGQVYTMKTQQLKLNMNYNKCSFTINPMWKRPAVFVCKFNDDLMFDSKNAVWTPLNTEFFTASTQPRIVIDSAKDDDYGPVLSGMLVFQVHIQYKVVGKVIDLAQPPLGTIHEVIPRQYGKEVDLLKVEEDEEAKEEVVKETALKNKTISKDKTEIPPITPMNPVVQQERTQEDNAGTSRANHKKRRILKRIQQRWDKIFTDENCYTSDEEELTSKSQSE